ncbi:hypothetical protein CDD81_1870 [Ophiocordyceps australis]|uniref:Uncharacterized protein n=1 Tax=Ophiocordyceps australis TaxID=1399860 RepID=A0A2C5XYS3_9HYPO|nr:hypothetical protein CDD81_1870 [Ophiocordyceps australis]
MLPSSRTMRLDRSAPTCINGATSQDAATRAGLDMLFRRRRRRRRTISYATSATDASHRLSVSHGNCYNAHSITLSCMQQGVHKGHKCLRITILAPTTVAMMDAW